MQPNVVLEVYNLGPRRLLPELVVHHLCDVPPVEHSPQLPFPGARISGGRASLGKRTDGPTLHHSKHDDRTMHSPAQGPCRRSAYPHLHFLKCSVHVFFGGC